MSKTIIKTSELPHDIQLLLREGYSFTGKEVNVVPTVDFTCPTNWHDANVMTLVVYNQTTSEHRAQVSGNYESHMNWSVEERAMYFGKLSTQIPDATIWFFLLETYPKSCTVYCHPTAIAKAIEGPKVELTRRQQIVLHITRSIISSYRMEEARTYKFTASEWNTCKAELFKLGLMRSNGSLTTDGKNAAQGLNFNSWEENKSN